MVLYSFRYFVHNSFYNDLSSNFLNNIVTVHVYTEDKNDIVLFYSVVPIYTVKIIKCVLI